MATAEAQSEAKPSARVGESMVSSAASLGSLGRMLKRSLSTRSAKKLRRRSSVKRALKRGMYMSGAKSTRKATKLTLEHVLAATKEPALDYYLCFESLELENAFQAVEADGLQRNAIAQAFGGMTVSVIAYVVLVVSGGAVGASEASGIDLPDLPVFVFAIVFYIACAGLALLNITPFSCLSHTENFVAGVLLHVVGGIPLVCTCACSCDRFRTCILTIQ